MDGDPRGTGERRAVVSKPCRISGERLHLCGPRPAGTRLQPDPFANLSCALLPQDRSIAGHLPDAGSGNASDGLRIRQSGFLEGGLLQGPAPANHIAAIHVTAHAVGLEQPSAGLETCAFHRQAIDGCRRRDGREQDQQERCARKAPHRPPMPSASPQRQPKLSQEPLKPGHRLRTAIGVILAVGRLARSAAAPAPPLGRVPHRWESAPARSRDPAQPVWSPDAAPMAVDPSLRPLVAADLPELVELYRDAVLSQTHGLYSDRQIQAWAHHAGRDGGLVEALARGVGLASCAAPPGRTIEAFALLDPIDRLSLLYCRGRSSRQGRATALLAALEGIALGHGSRRLRTEASQLSRPLLERLGWQVEGEEEVLFAGVLFRRWRMIKDLV